MPAPLRSWSEEVRGPDGRCWIVEVTVPYFDSAGHDGPVEHVVAVTTGRGLRRTGWNRRVESEAAADELQARLAAALRDGWTPGDEPSPEPK